MLKMRTNKNGKADGIGRCNNSHTYILYLNISKLNVAIHSTTDDSLNIIYCSVLSESLAILSDKGFVQGVFKSQQTHA